MDDKFPLDPTESSDNDNDGIGDNDDNDDDNDKVNDSIDAFPFDKNEAFDTDGDGIGNNEDTDDDGDGIEDSLDANPLDKTITTLKPEIKIESDDAKLTIGWKAIKGATSYNIYISTDINLTVDTYQEKIPSTDSLYSKDGLINDTTYYCLVEALSTTSVISTSDTFSSTPRVKKYAFSKPTSLTTEAPSIVVSTQRVIDRYTGLPVLDLLTNPDGTEKNVEDVFKILQDSSDISLIESFLDSEPLGDIPTTINTVLMLDLSSSISRADFDKMINAALNLVRTEVTNSQNVTGTVSNLSRSQQIAVYTFDDTVTQVIDFTTNHNDLASAIEGILYGGTNSTNLYGAIVEGFGRFTNQFKLNRVDYGYLILITDGQDTAGYSSLALALEAKGDKDLFVIGVGSELDQDTLLQLVLGEVIPSVDITSLHRSVAAENLFNIADFSLIDEKLTEVAESALSFSDGIYLLYYSSPSLTGTHNVDISLKSHDENCSQTWIDFAGDCKTHIVENYSANGFTAISPELVVNHQTVLNAGENYTFTAKTRWSKNIPNYKWETQNLDGGIIFSVSGDTTELSVQVPATTVFSAATVTVYDLNINTTSSYSITSTTPKIVIDVVAGNGVVIDNVNNDGKIYLTGSSPEKEINAALASSSTGDFIWSISDPSLATLSSTQGETVTITRNSSQTIGQAIITVTDSISSSSSDFIIDVNFGFKAVTEIDSNLGQTSCAISDKGLSCWGASSEIKNHPNLQNPSSVAVGNKHACVIESTAVVCWGDNSKGQTTVPSTLSNPVALSAGNNHSCALDDNGIKCWGDNSKGQASVPALSNPIQISAGAEHSCAIDDSGVKCWGDNTNGQTSAPALNNPFAISSGKNHSCAIDNNGVKCWGDNSNTKSSGHAALLINPIQITAGAEHSCAIDQLNATNSKVVCWGNSLNSRTSVPLTLVNPSVISAGEYHSCAADENGISCWGSFAGAVVPY